MDARIKKVIDERIDRLFQVDEPEPTPLSDILNSFETTGTVTIDNSSGRIYSSTSSNSRFEDPF